MRKDFVVLICLSLMVLMTGCGGSTDVDDFGFPDWNIGGGNVSPVARITIPAEGTIYTVGQVIQFVGSCSDREDGALIGASLVWTSDLDGRIDTGQACSSTTLRVGTHHITMTATDSGGAEGMDTVAITVNASSTPGILPDTGQTSSYTDTFGEDSDYSINPPAYTKLDASGSALNVGATDWVMVRNDATGLIWEVKTDDDSIHDKDNTYTWQNAQDVFIAQLNSDNFGGQSDWRMPTIKELSYLVNADAIPTFINTAYFQQNMFVYWSSTGYDAASTAAWSVLFVEGGNILALNKSDSFSVRAVRGGQISSNLIDNGDGTVTDTGTELMWQQAEAGLMTWEEALAYCETLTLAGHDDWRLPNRNELQSIVDYETNYPSIDTVFFPGTELAGYYLTSSTCPHGTGGAWSVHFYSGDVICYDKSISIYVRAVRTRQ